jgi:hypothetical protein
MFEYPGPVPEGWSVTGYASNFCLSTSPPYICKATIYRDNIFLSSNHNHEWSLEDWAAFTEIVAWCQRVLADSEVPA